MGDTRSLLSSWHFWLAVTLFWVFFGFIIGNHIYFSMRDHGHDWFRIVLWQMGGSAAWILLTPAVLALDRRFPLLSGRVWPSMLVHLSAALVFAAVRLAPLTALSLALDPFRPFPRKESFGVEYMQLLGEWMHLDTLVYVAILALAYALDYRERHFRDSLRASRLKADLAAAQVRALELEIHPHFLFNSLNAINMLVRGGEREKASGMVVGLADLLRLTLKRRDRQLVRVAEELEHARLYLDLQKARFEDRLQVDTEVAGETLGALVPRLVLQPLVENAIRHGIERRRGRGRVAISARRVETDDGPRLWIEVSDDGPGVEADAASSGSGIGLDNIRSRLEALYGEHWRLELRSTQEDGTRVTMEIPWQEAGPMETDT